MPRRVYSGFHPIEERLKTLGGRGGKDAPGGASYTVYYAPPPGPRVRNILTLARTWGVPCVEVPAKKLDSLAAGETSAGAGHSAALEHRGVLLVSEGEAPDASASADLDSFLAGLPPDSPADRRLVVILDSITDPRNVGAILRSACQFGASLVVMAKRNTVRDAAANTVVARTSAGASALKPVAVVPNLVSAAQKLKKAGFWVYGADPRGDAAAETRFAPRSAIVLGSEGSGISRLLAKECDIPVAIPMTGGVDSLNVSVAAGILFYEFSRQQG